VSHPVRALRYQLAIERRDHDVAVRELEARLTRQRGVLEAVAGHHAAAARGRRELRGVAIRAADEARELLDTLETALAAVGMLTSPAVAASTTALQSTLSRLRAYAVDVPASTSSVPGAPAPLGAAASRGASMVAAMDAADLASGPYDGDLRYHNERVHAMVSAEAHLRAADARLAAEHQGRAAAAASRSSRSASAASRTPRAATASSAGSSGGAPPARSPRAASSSSRHAAHPPPPPPAAASAPMYIDGSGGGGGGGDDSSGSGSSVPLLRAIVGDLTRENTTLRKQVASLQRQAANDGAEAVRLRREVTEGTATKYAADAAREHATLLEARVAAQDNALIAVRGQLADALRSVAALTLQRDDAFQRLDFALRRQALGVARSSSSGDTGALDPVAAAVGMSAGGRSGGADVIAAAAALRAAAMLPVPDTSGTASQLPPPPPPSPLPPPSSSLPRPAAERSGSRGSRGSGGSSSGWGGRAPSVGSRSRSTASTGGVRGRAPPPAPAPAPAPAAAARLRRRPSPSTLSTDRASDSGSTSSTSAYLAHLSTTLDASTLAPLPSAAAQLALVREAVESGVASALGGRSSGAVSLADRAAAVAALPDSGEDDDHGHRHGGGGGGRFDGGGSDSDSDDSSYSHSRRAPPARGGTPPAAGASDILANLRAMDAEIEDLRRASLALSQRARTRRAPEAPPAAAATAPPAPARQRPLLLRPYNVMRATRDGSGSGGGGGGGGGGARLTSESWLLDTLSTDSLESGGGGREEVVPAAAAMTSTRRHGAHTRSTGVAAAVAAPPSGLDVSAISSPASVGAPALPALTAEEAMDISMALRASARAARHANPQRPGPPATSAAVSAETTSATVTTAAGTAAAPLSSPAAAPQRPSDRPERARPPSASKRAGR